MKTAAVLSHVAFEDSGLLAPLLAEAGWTLSRREAAIDDLTAPELEAAGLLVVLGGPIGAYETQSYPFLAAETRLLEKRLAAGKPVLGICLGCQLMAQALGARVYFGGKKEIGWGKVKLTAEGEASALAPLNAPDAAVLHWHGDTFDIPKGAVRLAASAVYPNQAFSYGPNALALQFHLEAEPVRLENWFVGHACELSAARISIPELRAETARLKPVLQRQARQVFAPWLAGIEA
jgi:GMP synthase (glutamine-hydrolysing)